MFVQLTDLSGDVLTMVGRERTEPVGVDVVIGLGSVGLQVENNAILVLGLHIVVAVAFWVCFGCSVAGADGSVGLDIAFEFVAYSLDS